MDILCAKYGIRINILGYGIRVILVIELLTIHLCRKHEINETPKQNEISFYFDSMPNIISSNFCCCCWDLVCVYFVAYALIFFFNLKKKKTKPKRKVKNHQIENFGKSSETLYPF